jgi:hypothetical protein
MAVALFFNGVDFTTKGEAGEMQDSNIILKGRQSPHQLYIAWPRPRVAVSPSSSAASCSAACVDASITATGTLSRAALLTACEPE